MRPTYLAMVAIGLQVAAPSLHAEPPRSVRARLSDGQQTTLRVGVKLGEGRSPVYEAHADGRHFALKISPKRTAEREA